MLEIGPGAGNITEMLLGRARYVICIEKNPKYIPILSERFKDSSKLKIIRDDALKTYLPKHDRLVSNLPYMIAEAFLQRTFRLSFKSATLILPVRFAETLLAKQSGDHTKLSRLSQLFYDATQHEIITPEAYLPEPRVSTAIISLRSRTDLDSVESILKELILQGDKYTKNSLREALVRTSKCASKNDARRYIAGLNLEQRVLGSWASRLSLSDLDSIEEKLRAN